MSVELLLLKGGQLAGPERRVAGRGALKRHAQRVLSLKHERHVGLGLGSLDRVRIVHGPYGHGLHGRHDHLRVVEALGERGLAKRAETRERVIGAHLHAHVLALALLLLLETHAEGAADRVTQTLAPAAARSAALERVLGGHEAVAEPAACGTVAANVREAVLVVAIGRAKRDLLDGLVNEQGLVGLVHHAQRVARHVQYGLGGLVFFVRLAKIKSN